MNRFIILALLTLLTQVECHTIGARSERVPAAAIVARDPTFTEVANVAREPGIATIYDFLQRLQEKYPWYFRGYTLAYHSRSIQTSTFEDPRAIVFGKTGKLILAFNGSPNESNYGSVETLEFDDVKGPQLRGISFQAEPKHSQFAKKEIDERLSTRNIKITKANIDTCLECHGLLNAHPNWESYFLWPGFFGSEDDNVFRDNSDPKFSDSAKPYVSLARYFNLQSESDIEREKLMEFKRNRIDDPHSRYHVLRDLVVFNDYKYCDVFQPDCPSEFDNGINYWSDPNKLSTRPNLAFTQDIFRNFTRGISERILRDVNLRRYRFALVASWACYHEKPDTNFKVDRSIPAALPQNLLKWHESKSGTVTELWQRLLDQSKSRAITDIDFMREDFGASFGFPAGYDNLQYRWNGLLVGAEFNSFRTALQFIGAPYGFTLDLYATNMAGIPTTRTGSFIGIEANLIVGLLTYMRENDGYPQSYIDRFYSDGQDFNMGPDICERTLRDSQKELATLVIPKSH